MTRGEGFFKNSPHHKKSKNAQGRTYYERVSEPASTDTELDSTSQSVTKDFITPLSHREPKNVGEKIDKSLSGSDIKIGETLTYLNRIKTDGLDEEEFIDFMTNQVGMVVDDTEVEDYGKNGFAATFTKADGETFSVYIDRDEDNNLTSFNVEGRDYDTANEGIAEALYEAYSVDTEEAEYFRDDFFDENFKGGFDRDDNGYITLGKKPAQEAKFFNALDNMHPQVVEKVEKAPDINPDLLYSYKEVSESLDTTPGVPSPKYIVTHAYTVQRPGGDNDIIYVDVVGKMGLNNNGKKEELDLEEKIAGYRINYGKPVPLKGSAIKDPLEDLVIKFSN